MILPAGDTFCKSIFNRIDPARCCLCGVGLWGLALVVEDGDLDLDVGAVSGAHERLAELGPLQVEECLLPSTLHCVFPPAYETLLLANSYR